MKTLLNVLTMALLLNGINNEVFATEGAAPVAAVVKAATKENPVAADPLDAANIKTRMLLFAITSGCLLYAGYNLHDIVHADHIKETDEQCKRSGIDIIKEYTIDLTPKKMVRVGYMATFAAAAGYLWYIYGKSIVKYYSTQAKPTIVAQA